YIDYRSILSALSLRLDQLSGQIIVRHLPCQQAWIGAANIAQAGNREPLIGEPHQMRSISGISTRVLDDFEPLVFPYCKTHGVVDCNAAVEHSRNLHLIND